MAEKRLSEFSRSTKKVFSRATTTPRALNAGINQEFVDTRRRLDDVFHSIKRLIKTIESTRGTWATVAQEQRDFSRSLAASFIESGDVHKHAAEVEKKLRNLQEVVLRKDNSEAAHRQIVSVMNQYLRMLSSIQAGYKDVELAYTERTRYRLKVDRLQKKDLSHRKNSDKLVRNMEKLDDAQKQLDTKLESILMRMRSAFQKHEAVLQCAHHAFWMANDTHFNSIEQATTEIRNETVNVHKLLVDIELGENEQLEPVPRLNLLTAEDDSSGTEDKDEVHHHINEHNISSPIISPIEHDDKEDNQQSNKIPQSPANDQNVRSRDQISLKFPSTIPPAQSEMSGASVLVSA